MNKVWNTYISRVTLTFTLSVLFTVIFNLINRNTQGDYIFLLKLFGFIAFIEIIDYLLTKFSFKSRLAYLSLEFTTMYFCFLVFSFWGHWFNFTGVGIILFSFIFLILFLLVHLYYYFALKSEAETINNKLIKRRLK